LVRRRDVSQPRAWFQTFGLSDHESVIVDGNWNNASAGSTQRERRAWIPWIFHPRGIAGVEQQARGQVETLLGTGGHDDLAGIAAHTARGAHIFRDGLAERQVSACVTLSIERTRRATQYSARDT
jgi:hypothetical protein